MKDKLKGFLIGFILCALISGTIAIAANSTTLYDVITNGVKIVIDGKELNATDANGNHVEPIIYNGTTYLPVRAIAGAFDKPVYWDGENFTVYLGNMGGNLEYPSVYLKDMKSIQEEISTTSNLTDNYGNRYSDAVNNYRGHWEVLLNMKYSRFKGTLYVPEGITGNDAIFFNIIADGKTVYTSPEMTAASRPVDIDISVKGCNEFEIVWNNTSWMRGNYGRCIANAGFYQ